MKGFTENDCIILIKDIPVNYEETKLLKTGWEGTILLEPKGDSLYVEVFNEENQTVFIGTVDVDSVKLKESYTMDTLNTVFEKDTGVVKDFNKLSSDERMLIFNERKLLLTKVLTEPEIVSNYSVIPFSLVKQLVQLNVEVIFCLTRPGFKILAHALTEMKKQKVSTELFDRCIELIYVLKLDEQFKDTYGITWFTDFRDPSKTVHEYMKAKGSFGITWRNN